METGATRGTGRRELAALLLLLAAAWFVHAPLLDGEFVYDDRLVVLQNPVVADLARLPEAFGSGMWDFADADTARATGYWRPLATVLHQLAWAAGGADAWTFHLVSLLLHLAATAAAWAFAKELLRDGRAALIAAALWAFHPVHVESVAWISAVSDPAFGLCSFLALRAWLRARTDGRKAWSAGAWFLAALLCKEMALAVVPLVLLLELLLARGVGARWRPHASFGAALRALLPFGIALLAWYAGRAFAFGEWSAGLARTTTGFGVPESRLWLLRGELLGGGTRLAWWPEPLRLFRPFEPVFDWSAAWSGFALLALLSAGAWFCARRGARTAALALLFAPVALLPLAGRVEALGLFPLSDRYLYLASFGACLAAALLLSRRGRLGVAAAALLCVPLAAATRARLPMWRDEATLLAQAAAESPRAPYAQWQLGRVELERYRESGDVRALRRSQAAFDAAAELLAAAKRGDGSLFATGEDYLQTNVGYAWTLVHEAEIDEYHDYDTPARLFRDVVEKRPDAEEAWTGLGVALTLSGDLDGARAAFASALQANPRYPEAHENLGVLLARRGETEAARRSFEQALALRPGTARTQLRLAGMVERGGDPAGALAIVERAVQEHAGDARPLVARSKLMAAGKDMDAALRDADAALRLAPESGEAHLARARVLAARGEANAALVSAKRACDLLPASFDAHYLAAALLGAQGDATAASPYLVRAWTSRGSDAKAVEPALEAALDGLDTLGATGLLLLARGDGDRGDAARAFKWADRAVQVAPADAEAARTRAELYRRFGRAQEAAAEWARVCELDRDDPHAAEACAKLLLDAGDREGAKARLRDALERAKRMQGDAQAKRRTLERVEAGLAGLQGP